MNKVAWLLQISSFWTLPCDVPLLNLLLPFDNARESLVILKIGYRPWLKTKGKVRQAPLYLCWHSAGIEGGGEVTAFLNVTRTLKSVDINTRPQRDFHGIIYITFILESQWVYPWLMLWHWTKQPFFHRWGNHFTHCNEHILSLWQVQIANLFFKKKTNERKPFTPFMCMPGYWLFGCRTDLIFCCIPPPPPTVHHNVIYSCFALTWERRRKERKEGEWERREKRDRIG